MAINNMLATRNSAAQKTLIRAMLEWWMASNQEDAISQIEQNPGQDLAGISNSVLAGLKALAAELWVEAEALLEERNIEVLKYATPAQIVMALHAIHTQWVADNFSSRRWGEKYFKGQLPQYRKTAKLEWKEVAKDLLFISEYLKAGGNTCTEEEIQAAFVEYCAANAEDDDMQAIASKARTFAPDIIAEIELFREKLDPVKKAAMVSAIDEFLSQHEDGAEIMEIMIQAVVL